MMTQTKKRLYVAAGFLSLFLGFIGIFLPLLPTTPFLILAAFCFSRGSERWHQWLVTHPRMGPLILDWQQSGVIRMKAKVMATALIGSSFAVSFFCLTLKPLVLAVITLTLSSSLVFIWTRPSVPR
ncbi:MAG: YbaN family protein [Bdellovibrionaceae bacterium]|nr:YbaN family protein [Pseudobdellovibrionaceae bacterium]